jgi:hypothetical protein
MYLIALFFEHGDGRIELVLADLDTSLGVVPNRKIALYMSTYIKKPFSSTSFLSMFAVCSRVSSFSRRPGSRSERTVDSFRSIVLAICEGPYPCL